MKIAGIEIDESEAVAYATREWEAGRGVTAEDIRRKLFHSVPTSLDSHWIQCEAQRRICQWYRKLGVCRYDKGSGRWVAA